MKSGRNKKDVGLSSTDSSCQPQAKTSPALLSLNLSLQPGQLCRESQKVSKLPLGSHFSLWVGKNQAVEWSLWERKELNSSFMLSTLSQTRRDTIERLSRRTSDSLATEICRLLRRRPVPLCSGAAELGDLQGVILSGRIGVSSPSWSEEIFKGVCGI